MYIRQVRSKDLFRILSLLVFGAFLRFSFGCSSQPDRSAVERDHTNSSQTQEQVATAASSVVGITVASDYQVEQYHHEIRYGKPVRDPSSPTHYRLLQGASGITTTRKAQDVYGAGLVIYQEPAHSVILTSRHLLAPPDTINTYLPDEAGNTTDVLFSRAIKTGIVVHVVGSSGRSFPAEIVRVDSLSDLGMISVQIEGVVGLPFPYAVAYDTKIDWGYEVFAFGYPRGIKQVCFGVTSPSPYPGTFAMDAAARFGYSGGPVLVVTPGGELSLAGVVRGAQVNKLQLVAPPADVPPGQVLGPEDLKGLKSDEFTMIEFGVSYAVGVDAIGTFLTSSARLLDAKGIYLAKRFFPPH